MSLFILNRGSFFAENCVVEATVVRRTSRFGRLLDKIDQRVRVEVWFSRLDRLEQIQDVRDELARYWKNARIQTEAGGATSVQMMMTRSEFNHPRNRRWMAELIKLGMKSNQTCFAT